MRLHLSDNEAFVAGRSPKKAKELLAKADAAGISPDLVRTTAGGYIVPKALLEEPEDTGFDPADHTVDEVVEHLESADSEEAERVLSAEKAGKSRKGIVENTKE